MNFPFIDSFFNVAPKKKYNVFKFGEQGDREILPSLPIHLY